MSAVGLFRVGVVMHSYSVPGTFGSAFVHEMN
jgi:hypothetical protein